MQCMPLGDRRFVSEELLIMRLPFGIGRSIRPCRVAGVRSVRTVGVPPSRP
jgi:hypothetical protein